MKIPLKENPKRQAAIQNKMISRRSGLYELEMPVDPTLKARKEAEKAKRQAERVREQEERRKARYFLEGLSRL